MGEKLKEIKSNLLYNAWGIVIIQLISFIIFSLPIINNFSNNEALTNGTTSGLAFFFYYFIVASYLSVMLCFLGIPFIVCFVSVIITTINVKKSKKTVGTYSIINYVFQVVFCFIVWHFKSNLFISVACTLVAIIGGYISFRAYKYIKQYNEMVSNIENEISKNQIDDIQT